MQKFLLGIIAILSLACYILYNQNKKLSIEIDNNRLATVTLQYQLKIELANNIKATQKITNLLNEKLKAKQDAAKQINLKDKPKAQRKQR
jgi:hypothetical protein